MSNPVTHAICPKCSAGFSPLFAHQKFCSVPCAFWGRVDPSPDGCWEWSGSVGSSGYGEFRYNGKLMRSHRTSYELHYGPIPAGMSVLHECDNRKCCRPSHLYAGTQGDNMGDARRRFRHLKKLTPEQVQDAERRMDDGRGTMAQLARELGVSHGTIRAMRERRNRLGAVS